MKTKPMNNTDNLKLEYPYGRGKIIYNGLYGKNLKKIDAASVAEAQARAEADGAINESLGEVKTVIGMPYSSNKNITERLTALEQAVNTVDQKFVELGKLNEEPSE